MLDRRMTAAAALAGLLTACTGSPPAPSAATPATTPAPAAQTPGPAAGSAAAQAQPAHCGFQALGHSVRPGEDLQFVFTVKPDSQWCFDGFAISGLSTSGETIATPPEHGRVRLVRRPGAVVIGYRPAPGFVGTDRFRIGVPTSIETSYFAGNVTVAP